MALAEWSSLMSLHPQLANSSAVGSRSGSRAVCRGYFLGSCRELTADFLFCKTEIQWDFFTASLTDVSGSDPPKSGGGGWTRTNDLRIMSRPTGANSKERQQDSSADSGKVPQNPRLR